MVSYYPTVNTDPNTIEEKKVEKDCKFRLDLVAYSIERTNILRFVTRDPKHFKSSSCEYS